MHSFAAIWKQRLWSVLPDAYRFFQDYLEDDRPFKRIQVASFPFIIFEGEIIGVPNRGENLREFPELLFANRRVPGRIFSMDNDIENRLRQLYHQPDKDFRKAIDEILNEKFKGDPPKVPQPSAEMAELEFFWRDPYLSAVKGMYGAQDGTPHAKPLKGGILKPDTHKFVLLGHTHDEKETAIEDLGVTYFNTGSWSVHRDENGKNTSRLCYVTFEKSPGGNIRASQQFWH